eukprot:TRINITY_DN2933_c0_g1_i1.p1 TRINITY_DN2933_c0_g1~~TRINITY_DN2933_c0_g1_i1.p1  ORF type:complete len:551 (-),score=119.75 TRINITY_DN2933_c0_g1_i1:76-1686(-)
MNERKIFFFDMNRNLNLIDDHMIFRYEKRFLRKPCFFEFLELTKKDERILQIKFYSDFLVYLTENKLIMLDLMTFRPLKYLSMLNSKIPKITSAARLFVSASFIIILQDTEIFLIDMMMFDVSKTVSFPNSNVENICVIEGFLIIRADNVIYLYENETFKLLRKIESEHLHFFKNVAPNIVIYQQKKSEFVTLSTPTLHQVSLLRQLDGDNIHAIDSIEKTPDSHYKELLTLELRILQASKLWEDKDFSSALFIIVEFVFPFCNENVWNILIEKLIELNEIVLLQPYIHHISNPHQLKKIVSEMVLSFIEGNNLRQLFTFTQFICTLGVNLIDIVIDTIHTCHSVIDEKIDVLILKSLLLCYNAKNLPVRSLKILLILDEPSILQHIIENKLFDVFKINSPNFSKHFTLQQRKDIVVKLFLQFPQNVFNFVIINFDHILLGDIDTFLKSSKNENVKLIRLKFLAKVSENFIIETGIYHNEIFQYYASQVKNNVDVVDNIRKFKNLCEQSFYYDLELVQSLAIDLNLFEAIQIINER